MRKKKLPTTYFIWLFLSFGPALNAQTIESSINLYGANFPAEKIHIHFDKETYLPGETIWFKAYLFEENLPSERSTNFYTAFYDEEGKLIKQQVSPIFGGTADGHFEIPDSIRSSQLICRAYTSWMLNFDTSMLFARALKIIKRGQAAVPADVSAYTTSLTFFPEGGDIIEGNVNTIAFKANYNDGLPFEISGTIKKQATGDSVMPLTVLHNGMGKFDIDIQPGDKYYCEWTDNTGTKRQTFFPTARPAGVALKLALQKDKFYFNLFNKTNNDSLHVIMYMYQKVFYRSNIKVPIGSSFTGIVPITNLPAGVMQVTVFDSNWQPVAERIAFLSNSNSIFDAAIFTRAVSTQKKGKNVLEIFVSDSIPANMSLSVSDAEMNNTNAENTILSDLLLKGDIKGYIHNPAFYFSNNADASVKEKLDLVMLTHGWRRYNWNNMMAQKMPILKYPADEYLGVYGQVGKDIMTNRDKDERINLIIKTADSTNTFYSLMPDKTGLLKQRGLVFYDSARVYFSFNKNKANNGQIAFSKFNFTYPAANTINNYSTFLFRKEAGTFFDSSISLFQYLVQRNAIKKFNDEKTLKDVTVKTRRRSQWKNDPMLKLDGKYATGMFTGGVTGYAADVLHDEKAWTKLDIYSYLRSSMPSLMIGSYNLLNGRSISFNNKPVLIYIDEHEMMASDLENLSLSQVAYIKLIPYFLGSGAEAGTGGLQPALSVYTKKGDDLFERRITEKDLGMIKLAGYSPVKEFYSPDYADTNTNVITDSRTTLLWMPYILTDKVNNRIPITFYNNDFTRRMRIVLEGVNDEGKMIRIEKIIE